MYIFIRLTGDESLIKKNQYLCAGGIIMNKGRRLEQEIEKLSTWLQKQVREAGAKGAVFGLSGGIDSAVAAALCKKAFARNTLGLILPCFSPPGEVEDARLVAEKLALPYRLIELSEAYLLLAGAFSGKEATGKEKTPAFFNIKPRLRMIALYYWASSLSYLVVGTGNRSELAVGYFTKYGDGGVDLLPLGHLVKTEVQEIARALEIPEKIINKPPSGGLWEGQTDEGELGLTYNELDRYLLTGEGNPSLVGRIRKMERKSGHKRRPPLVPGDNRRDSEN